MQKQTKLISPAHSSKAGFTLVEILVVLGIIAVLAALLFPAFSRMQERGRQTNCAANLKQIAVAVQQYYQEEKFYPVSLTVLMPQDVDFNNDNTPDNAGSAAFLGSLDIGKCLDDDTESATPRLSYGAFGNATPAPLTTTPPADPGQYVWNYWGYRADGYAYQSANDAATANPAPSPYLVYKNAANPYNHPLASGFDLTKPRNVVEHSLSNRYAPKSTIITHCVYHRLPTANNLNNPSELYYNPDLTAGQGARDIILLLSGEAKTLDVSAWNTSGLWQTQKF